MSDLETMSPIERARVTTEQVMERHYAEEFQRAQPGDSKRARAVAKELATLVLARLGVPGDVELHENVFQMARETVAERYPGVSAGDIGDMGIPLRQ